MDPSVKVMNPDEEPVCGHVGPHGKACILPRGHVGLCSAWEHHPVRMEAKTFASVAGTTDRSYRSVTEEELTAIRKNAEQMKIDPVIASVLNGGDAPLLGCSEPKPTPTAKTAGDLRRDANEYQTMLLPALNQAIGEMRMIASLIEANEAAGNPLDPVLLKHVYTGAKQRVKKLLRDWS